MTPEYDAIVVGARCAGSPTAMLLARSGHRVLLVDRATFPSDTLSTHVIHAPGVAALRRWGLLDAVIATGCPPIETYSFDFGPFTIAGTPRPCEGSSVGYAPAAVPCSTRSCRRRGGRRRRGAGALLGRRAARRGRRRGRHPRPRRRRHRDGASRPRRGRRRRSAAPGSPRAVAAGAVPREAATPVEPTTPTGATCPSTASTPSSAPTGAGAPSRPTTGSPCSSWAGPTPRRPPTRPTSRATTCAPSSWRPSSPPACAAPPGWSRSPAERCPTSSASRTARAGRWSATPATRRTRSPPKACPTPSVTPSCAPLPSTRPCGAARSFDDAMSAYQLTRDAQVLPIYEFTTQLATLEPPPPEVQQLLGAVAGNQRGDGHVRRRRRRHRVARGVLRARRTSAASWVPRLRSSAQVFARASSRAASTMPWSTSSVSRSGRPGPGRRSPATAVPRPASS